MRRVKYGFLSGSLIRNGPKKQPTDTVSIKKAGEKVKRTGPREKQGAFPRLKGRIEAKAAKSLR